MPDSHIELSAEARRALTSVSTATLTSQLLMRGYRATFIAGVQPLRPDVRMVGRAFTLRYAPSREDVGFRVDYDNSADLQRLAVERVGPGDVLVIDARGQTRAASFGHIIATRIAKRGAAGLVTDGSLRDTPAFRSLNLPVYCAGAHAVTSSVAHYAVDMQVPIGCGEVLVMPGDMVVGDAEGVVVLPQSIAEEVAIAASEQELVERYALERVREGESIRGLYPLAEEQRTAFETWRHGHGRVLDAASGRPRVEGDAAQPTSERPSDLSGTGE
jgi:regulator of RNase E activity RraA